MLARGYTEDQIKMMRQNITSTPARQSAGLVIKGDLDRFHYPYFQYITELFIKYDQNGILPFEGPLADQPNQIIEILDLFKVLRIETETEMIEKHKKEQKRVKKRG